VAASEGAAESCILLRLCFISSSHGTTELEKGTTSGMPSRRRCMGHRTKTEAITTAGQEEADLRDCKHTKFMVRRSK